MKTIYYTIRGYLVGDIWMPAVECFKEIDYDFVRHEEDRGNPFVACHGNLREALLKITNDGDFRSCNIADGTLTIIIEDISGTRKVTKERSWDLDRFKNISDMLTTWDGPPFYDE